MNAGKTYVVSFYERNYYRITVTAPCEDEALEKADNLYCEEKMSLFELVTSLGGTDDWQAEEVQS